MEAFTASGGWVITKPQEIIVNTLFSLCVCFCFHAVKGIGLESKEYLETP